MRRVAVVTFVLSALIACSSSDDSDVFSGGGHDSGTRDGDTSADPDGAVSSTDSSSDASTSDSAMAEVFSGEATYYAADGTGACGFKASPNDLNVGALNGDQYKKSWCGQCVLVTGPKGTVKVRIVDLCPGCSMGDLDLSKQAFSAIAALSAGRVKITWHVVTC
jgi:expansin (peptidoglycan-binding protein)